MQNPHRQLNWLALTALALSPMTATKVQAQYQLTPLDPPGQPSGISDSGTIAVQAFSGEALLVKGDSVTSISSPNVLGFQLGGINSRGTTVGTAFAEDFSTFGFVRTRQGEITSLAIPGAVFTCPEGINERGVVVGSVMAGDFATHGFVWDSTGPKLFDAPGAELTALAGINASGTAVGRYIIGGRAHAFTVNGSRFSPLDIPDASSSFANGINSHGQIVGSYRSSVRPDLNRGFIYDRGAVTSVDFFSDEDAPASFPPEPFDFGDAGSGTVTYVRNRIFTFITGINDRGEIVGVADARYTPRVECGGCGLNPRVFGNTFLFGSFFGKRDGSSRVTTNRTGNQSPRKLVLAQGATASGVQSLLQNP